MITKHSIDLKKVDDPCFATNKKYGGCKILTKIHQGCGTFECPFYKPYECKDWVRIEDRTGINLIPPEDLK